MNQELYDVFLSYRHKPLDGVITQQTFNILESFRLPKALRDQGYHGVRRVFRDTEELPVSRILTQTIDAALRTTKCLVVVCSTDTPSSEWVDREVAVFIELGKAEQIYPLLITGTPETSFPASMKLIPDIMDRVIDVRAPGNDAKAIVANIRRSMYPVIAAVSGCEEDDLRREHNLEVRRRTAMLAGGTALLFAFVAAVSAFLWNRAEQYRAKTVAGRSAALSLLSELTYALPDSLVNLPGTYDAVAGILEDNSAQIRRILEISGYAPETEMEIAANEEKLATALLTLGRHENAETHEREAISIYQSIPTDTDVGQGKAGALADANLGRIQEAAGNYEAAAKSYEAAEQALRAQNASPEELAALLGNAGALKLMEGDLAGADETLSEAARLFRGLPDTGDTAILSADAACLYHLGLVKQASGAYAEAEEKYREGAAIYQRLNADPEVRIYQIPALRLNGALANCISEQGRYREAGEMFLFLVNAAKNLAEDEDNAEAQNLFGELCNNYGLCLNAQGEYSRAALMYENYADIEKKRYEKEGTQLSQASYARALYNVAENAFKAGEYGKMLTDFTECIRLYGPVSEDLGSYHRSEYLARLAYFDIIVKRDYAAAEKAAREAFDEQPESLFVCYNLGYALLMNKSYEDCDKVFEALAATGAAAAENVRLDFEAMKKAGISDPHMDEVLQMMTR